MGHARGFQEKKFLSPIVARELCLDNIHSASQVIFLQLLLLEGNGRDAAWLLHPSDMRERSHQPHALSSPSASAPSLPRLCADQPEADGNQILLSKALFSSHCRIFADLLSRLLSKVVF